MSRGRTEHFYFPLVTLNRTLCHPWPWPTCLLYRGRCRQRNRGGPVQQCFLPSFLSVLLLV